MLQVVADIFSGRENPRWFLDDEREAREIYRRVAADARQAGEAERGGATGGLGFRGLVLEPASDEFASEVGASALRITPAMLREDPRLAELAERILGQAAPSAVGAEAEEGPELIEELRGFLLDQVGGSSRISTIDAPEGAAKATTHEGEAAGGPSALASCTIELGAFNPGFWNNDATIRSRNNCYNYASNKRTDTFAQPGRGAGSMYTSFTCAEVTRASLADGLRRRFNCFPDSEKPRYLVALVIWPGRDFHWYRKQKEGYWGHKPGSTNARNTDNSGRVITNPETCDRGNYTQFCGYFYTCKSQKIR